MQSIIKQYLQQAQNIAAEIDAKTSEFDNLQKMAKRAENILPKEFLAKITAQERQITDEINSLLDTRAKIREKIMHLDNGDERRILLLRYINNLSWQEIALNIRLSLRQIFRIHQNALKNFR